MYTFFNSTGRALAGLTASSLLGLTAGATFFGKNVREISTLTPSNLDQGGNETRLQKNKSGVWYLHANMKTTCYVIKAKYEYEAFTSSDASGSDRIPVKKIKMDITRDVGSASYNVEGADTSYLPHTDDVTAYPTACGKSCMTASAFAADGSYAKTQTICVP
ncbi:MAG: hypothetical protein JSS53_05015 [Proteobacteria bacterium]|nr:hypothetical protein [Pseudomonadota bacterium]